MAALVTPGEVMRHYAGDVRTVYDIQVARLLGRAVTDFGFGEFCTPDLSPEFIVLDMYRLDSNREKNELAGFIERMRSYGYNNE